ncbi:hypothetical protein TIFTF001_030722 [Ficus carica]|uniref:Uncharacterized protein n=1 Tax=Ficus carica TaxID=3494 RepID=A0AA88DTM4_FICCA|nr:hypothetical protein TIFTF001_030722 [Ficus carica]
MVRGSSATVLICGSYRGGGHNSDENGRASKHIRSRPVWINGILVYRMADMEMVDWARGRLVYMVDYLTSAVTPEYLESLLEEFQIPGDVELIVPSLNDLPFRPRLDGVTLSAEFFRAGLHLPFHPFLRWALQRLNVAPMHVFQNLYRMKIAPSYIGSYYFQGYQGMFIAGCPNSDKNYKHLWFYATAELHPGAI